MKNKLKEVQKIILEIVPELNDIQIVWTVKESEYNMFNDEDRLLFAEDEQVPTLAKEKDHFMMVKKKFHPRIIRLCDVMLALHRKDRYSSNMVGVSFNGGFYTAGRLVATWDLERNFLWAQSQQTIEYLYDIFYGQQ